MKTIFTIRHKSALQLIFVLFLLVPFSCRRDLLDLAPDDRVSESTVFDTPERINKLLYGLYGAFRDPNFYGGRFIVFRDVPAEDFLAETFNVATGLEVWNHSQGASTPEVNAIWNATYYTINSCNIFIDGVQKNRAVLNDDQLALQYEAEAKCIRALCYYSLLTVYARPYADGNGAKPGVVLRLLPEPGSSPKLQARASAAEVYDQILADISFAAANLPLDYGDAYQNTTRLHRNSAIALTTRILLTMGRYQELIAEADKIVPNAAPFAATSGVPNALASDISAVFTAPYTSVESIFSLPYIASDAPGVQQAPGGLHNPAIGFGDYSINPAGIMGDAAWAVDDDRRQFIYVAPSSGKPYLNKFPIGPPCTDYIPVLRYAEVLLNLSEAIARTAGLSQRAVDLLNAVRGRSNPAGVYALSDFANADALITAILKERRIELLGEGFRSNDCLRLLLPIPGKANVAAVQPDQAEYIWPIPSSEVSVNKLCVQNPGY